jgi:2-oxoglutarate ferredoxin oxidoreductase subunit gamma
MARTRIVFSGSGGQGVITASIILAEAAVLYENLIAVQAQSYGAAARGGRTRADVIISDETINYPKVVQPNILICLTQESYNAYSSIIRPGGLLITDTRYVKIQRKVDAQQHELPIRQTVLDALGSPVVTNICMLGAFTALTNLVKSTSIEKVLKKRIQPEFLEMNRKALQLGMDLGQL